MKTYKIDKQQIIKRAKRLGIKPKGRTKLGTALLSLEDVQRVVNGKQ